MKPINVAQKYGKFDQQWLPHRIAMVDDMQVILAKVSGEFVWHSHKNEDELFFVQRGRLEMRFRKPAESETDSGEPTFTSWSEYVNEGEMIIVPKGVEHCPATADGEEVHLLLFEKLSTAHTGEVVSEKTQSSYPDI